jgi:uncharacterized protein YrrD
MENLQALRRWSTLNGIAVVAIFNGKKIGTCDDFYFETQTLRIYALRVKTGLFSHKVMPAASINTIGEDAITFANEEALHNESDDSRLATLLTGEGLHKYRVMSVGGTLMGTLGDVLLDTSTPNGPRIAAFELSGSLREQLSRKYPTFAASQVVSYGHDVLVIPDEVAQSLH